MEKKIIARKTIVTTPTAAEQEAALKMLTQPSSSRVGEGQVEKEKSEKKPAKEGKKEKPEKTPKPTGKPRGRQRQTDPQDLQRLTLDLPKSLYQRLSQQAQSQGTTLRFVVLQLLEKN